MASVRPRAAAKPHPETGAPPPGQRPGRGGQQHEGEHHREVFHHEPAHRGAAALGPQDAALLQGPGQHHRARHRQRQAEDEPGAQAPAEDPGEAHAERGHQGDLGERARQRDGPDRQEVPGREVQADREQQQGHADIGELVGEVLVGDEAGRERPDRDARQQVADQGRGAQAVRRHPEGEGEHDADHEGGDERRVVLHRSRRAGVAWAAAPSPLRGTAYGVTTPGSTSL